MSKRSGSCDLLRSISHPAKSSQSQHMAYTCCIREQQTLGLLFRHQFIAPILSLAANQPDMASVADSSSCVKVWNPPDQGRPSLCLSIRQVASHWFQLHRDGLYRGHKSSSIAEVAAINHDQFFNELSEAYSRVAAVSQLCLSGCI